MAPRLPSNLDCSESQIRVSPVLSAMFPRWALTAARLAVRTSQRGVPLRLAVEGSGTRSFLVNCSPYLPDGERVGGALIGLSLLRNGIPSTLTASAHAHMQHEADFLALRSSAVKAASALGLPIEPAYGEDRRTVPR